MKPPFGVVDADGHINEPEARLLDFLEPPYREFLHPSLANPNGTIYPTNSLAPKLAPGLDPTLGGRLGSNGPVGFPTPADWLEAMEAGGLAMTVLYPTTLLGYSAIIDPDYLVAITRAYNTYVYEDWLKVNPRFQAVALMPLLEVEESVKELRRAVTELGFVGAFLPATGFGLLGEKRLHPLYAEAERLGCVIAVHGGHATAEYMRYTRFIQRHTIGFPVSNIIQMTHMTYEGIFALFPTLRVAYLEAGCTWVPYMLNRMDDEWEKRGEVEAPQCKQKPSTYIKSDRVFFHAESGEDLIPQVLDILGDNSLVYASDWPHWDHEYPQSVGHLWERQDLSESQKRAMLADNARAMYGLKTAVTAPEGTD
ncbi:MAG: amidohydrolase family protein [bacterium]|nr:amidohydrolase family protein [bacterium]